MRKPINIVGKRFGRLVVIGISHRDKFKQVVWDCVCDCGNQCQAVGLYLRAGKKRSCGCLENENKEKILGNHFTHTLSHSPVYNMWKHMRARCMNKNDKRFKRYGGRGITICEEWDDPQVFYNWAVSHGYKQGLTIDRINNDGNYEPDNCRFVLIKINVRNNSNVKINEEQANQIRNIYAEGEIRQIDLAKMFGVSQQVVSKIVNHKLWVSILS